MNMDVLVKLADFPGPRNRSRHLVMGREKFSNSPSNRLTVVYSTSPRSIQVFVSPPSILDWFARGPSSNLLRADPSSSSRTPLHRNRSVPESGAQPSALAMIELECIGIKQQQEDRGGLLQCR